MDDRTGPPPNIYSSRCLSRQALDLIADKWAVLILRALESGPEHSGDLLRRIDGITRKMLTQTLRELERNGLVSRRTSGDVPARVEYSLTPLGGSLSEPIRQLAEWAMTHLDDVRAARLTFQG